jgi:hypothetical protein
MDDYDEPWISVEADKKLIARKRLVKAESETLRMLSEVQASLTDRKKRGLTVKKGAGRIRIWLDEIDSYSQEAQEFISSVVRDIEYQYAKYGATIVIGSHSLKKGEMGIDSSVTDSMLQILFGGIVLDRNSPLSGAFPSKLTIKKEIEAYKASNPEVRVVYIKDDYTTFPSHIPHLILPEVNVVESSEVKDSDFEKVYLVTEGYFKTNPDKLTLDNVRLIWSRLTKVELNDTELQYLYEKLKGV